MSRSVIPEADPVDGDRRPAVRRLRRLGRLDVFFLLICSLVGLDTIGSIAASGPEAFTWLVLALGFFFVPYGLVVAELSATFPVEGGQYVWGRMAFGRTVAGIAQAVYWLSNPVWLGGALTVVAMTTFETFVHPLPGGWKYVAGLVFIWAGVASLCASLRVGRWVPAAGAAARIVLMGFFFVSTVIYGFVHGIQPVHVEEFRPTYLGLLALAPVIVFTFVGFEVSSSAAEEMDDPQRSIPLGILRSGVTSFVMIALPVLGILLVLPRGQVTHLSGFLDAAKAVFTVYGGHVEPSGEVVLTGAGAVIGVVCALGMIVALFTSGVSWGMGESRAQAAACSDGAGPAFFGGVSERFGTPVRINLLGGVLATGFMVATLSFTGGDSGRYFNAGLNLAISMTMIAYLVMFPTLPVLRRRLPDVRRPFVVPGGRWASDLAAGLATVVVVLTIVQLVYPGIGVGWFGTSGTADDGLPSAFAGQRLAYELTQVVPLALFLVFGVVFVVLGRRDRQR